jgi:hypothetical protein
MPPGGSIYRASIVAPESPIVYGYAARFPVYSRQTPLLDIAPIDTLDYGGPMDSATTAQIERDHPRVVVAFAPADSVLLSGYLGGTTEPAGRPAVVDAPVGAGHLVLFAIRPMWRWETHGTFALLINAVANWNALSSRSSR